MKAAQRDAKIAEAKVLRGKRAKPAKPVPWAGLFEFFRNLLGEPAAAPVRRRRTQLRRQQARRHELERKVKQQKHEAYCDARFQQQRAEAKPITDRPTGQLRRHWKRSWIEAEAYAEDERRSHRRRKA